MSNSLAAMRPELVREWSDKNLPLTPDKITYKTVDEMAAQQCRRSALLVVVWL